MQPCCLLSQRRSHSIVMLIIFSRIFYIICLSSLNVSLSKKWLIYIKQSIQTRTQQCNSDMADHLTALRYQSALLERWCNLPSKSDIDANNTSPWAPCGAVQYVTMQMRHVIQWEIKVQSEFVIDIYFHVFHVDASGELCVRSAVVVYGKHTFPIFCGNRKPWTEIVEYHVAIIHAHQIDVLKQMQLAFTYFIFDPIHMRERVLQTRANKITMKDKPKQSLAYVDILALHYLRIWYLVAPIGKVIAVTSDSSRVPDHILIFTGFGRHHPANNGVLGKKQAKIINYFVASIYLYNHTVINSINLHLLTFWHLNLTTQPLLSSSIRVHNDDGIYYKMFSIQTKPGSFPNVSFHVQRFEGWHEGGCTYGGFLFKQFLHDSLVEPQTLGPYCTETEPNHPLTGTDGLDYLVFGDSGIDLIIYANGPFYTIDMEVVVSESSCVGVVSPLWLCSFSKNEIDPKRVVKFPGYSIVCSSSGFEEKRKLHIKFVHISQCVIFQNIEKDLTNTVLFSIIAHIHFRLTMRLRNNVLLPHRASRNGTWGFTYIQDDIGVVSLSLSSTTVLTGQHVSSVSHLTTPYYKRMYSTYSLYVVPLATNFSCVDTKTSTHKLSQEVFIDMKYLVNVEHICGAGVYNDKGKYFFKFTVHSIFPLMLFLQVMPSSCQTSNSTHDVLIACHDANNCYAADLLDKVFHFYTTFIGTSYRYEKKSLCSTFTIEYNFVRHDIMATNFPHNFKTIYVSILAMVTINFSSSCLLGL